MEALHRNAISEISPLLREDDLVIQSDLDEVPDPLAFDACKRLIAEGHQSIRMTQRNHYFFVNCALEKWGGSIFMTAGFFKTHLPHQIRTDKSLKLHWCHDAGWHWSFLGGIEAIRAKLAAYAHFNLFAPPFNEPAHIQECLDTGKDLFNRGQVWKRYDMSEYRQDVREILEEYPHLISNGQLPGGAADCAR
jgi:beta-1,4-mannosyl-glycoprotein beta-1,4-N-acetylglucosaminyltransferase